MLRRQLLDRCDVVLQPPAHGVGLAVPRGVEGFGTERCACVVQSHHLRPAMNRVKSKLHPRKHLRERKSCAGSTHNEAELGQRLAAPAGGLVEVQIHERASSPPNLRARICPQQQPSDQGPVGTSMGHACVQQVSTIG